MNAALRLSPSGPVITNVVGAPLKFGSGARLRLVESTSTCGAGNTIPTVPAILANPIGTGTVSASLVGPSPGLAYRATVLCDVMNPTTNVTQQVELYIDTSPDGVTWTERASNSHVVAAGTARMIRLDLPLSSGASNGVTAGDGSLNFRCRIGASTGGGSAVVSAPVTPGAPAGSSKGTILQTFEETF